MIRHYTINFYGQGKVNKNQMQSVYLRYLYTDQGRKRTVNFETGHRLTKEHIALLKSNQLGGIIQEDLIKKKSQLIQVVETLNLRDNTYPDCTALKEYFNKTVNVLSIEHYLNLFLHSLTDCKQQSKDIYEINLQRFVNYVKANNKNVHHIVNKFFVEIYFKGFNHINGKVYNKSNSTIKNTTAIVVRFLNFIAGEINVPEIKYTNKIKEVSNKLHLTEEQLNKMLTLDLQSSDIRKDRKQNLINCQNLTKINSVIGLRINELLSVRRDMIAFNKDYVRLEFVDQKLTQVRSVVVKDKDVIDLIKYYSNSDNPFNVMDYKLYSNMLKQLAKLSGLTQTVTLFSIKATTKDTYNSKPLWKHVSSHCIRRYAIQRNLVKYGLVVTRQFSGHKSYQMIEKFYSRNLDEQELLKALE